MVMTMEQATNDPSSHLKQARKCGFVEQDM